jgi:hypothetical protein
MLKAIAPREKPFNKGPRTPVDHMIIQVLTENGPSEPRTIRDLIPDSDLQYIHARLRRMVSRGAIQQVKTPGGPRRGPGSSLYQLP